MSRSLIAVSLLLAAVTSSAQSWTTEKAPQSWCATNEPHIEELDRLHRWSEAGDRTRNRKVAANGLTRQTGEVYLMASDDVVMPFDKPVDLVGSSITLRRKDAASFSVVREPLSYVEPNGTVLRGFAASPAVDSHFATHKLTKFTFPFGEETYDTLYISASGGITFTAPARLDMPQYGPLESIVSEVPTIAPLLRSLPALLAYPVTFVSETADSVTITWRSSGHPFLDYDFQAVLSGNGDIRFNYKKLTNTVWGSTIVTTGKEPSRNRRSTLLSATDVANDTTQATPVDLAGMLDVESVEVTRIAGSNVLEARITVREPLVASKFPSQGAGYFLRFAPGVDVFGVIYPDRHSLYTPTTGTVVNSLALKVSGRVLTMQFLEESVPVAVRRFPFETATYYSPGQLADSLKSELDLGQKGESFMADLSSMQSAIDTDRPLIEAFTLGTLNPAAVWTRMKNEFGVGDTDVDAVAIYQTFLTDIITYASAYSTVGNPGVDGISSRGGYGTGFAKRPGLMHMNRLNFGINANSSTLLHVLGHEFGHRWLYFFRFKDGAMNSTKLNPGGGHPAQYVHTPAAFKVFSDTDSSTMGGGFFQELAPGTFITPPALGYYGYSWHDLYLMGLAKPEEVPPWFYIDNSVPALGPAYYPPSNQAYTGVRKDVNIGQIVEAMGPRRPAANDSPKAFKIAFVLIDRADTPATNADLDAMNSIRKQFEAFFPVATGTRGSITTTAIVAAPLLADFSVNPSVLVTNVPSRFTDTTSGVVSSRNWDFGDGTTSTAAAANHTYTVPGNYAVKLTVSGPAGTSSKTAIIAVTAFGNGKSRRR